MLDRYIFGTIFFLGLSFSSGFVKAQTFNGQGGLLVPPGAPIQTVGITTSEATVTGIGILGTGCSYIENVTIDFTHTYDGDVALFLIAPSGEVLELSSSNGGPNDNYQITVFTDNTAQFINSGFPPFNGTFRPEGVQTSTTPPFPQSNPLGTYTFQNTFTGVNADGDWTLLINDYVPIDVGVLNAWSITFASGGGPAPSVTLGPDVTICPGQSTTLTASVVPTADSYLWNTGATTSSISVSPNVNTTYSVTVTNNDCIDADTIQVIINPNGVTANAGPDVSVCQGTGTTLSGSGGSVSATYNWSTGQTGSTISVNPLSTTTYTLTVTDNGCSDTDQVVVSVTPNPVAEAGQPVTICEGQSASLTASGGTQNNHYTWSTGQNGSTIVVSPVNTTTYTVTVTINGCSDTDDVSVTVNDVPTVSAGPDVQICSGESTTLTASGSGGTYVWSNGQPGPVITVSPAATTTYTVTVTENGCTATDNVTVTVGNITAGVTPSQSICEGSTITLTATGGTNYMWSTGDTGPSISVTPPTTTTYTVTATQGSCSDEASVTITVNPIPVATVSPDEEICAGEFVTLTASGGIMYMWSSGQNTSTINVNPPITTNYTVTVTANGCSSTASVLVDVNPTPNAFAGADQNICVGESVTLTATGLAGPGTYAWSTGESVATIIVEPIVTTTYTVTITNEWNCFDTDAVTVTVNPIPIANAGPDQDLCEGNSITLTATGGTIPSTYQWSTGQSGSTITVTPALNTDYTVTVTVAGCSSEDEVTVSVFPSPVAFAGDDQEICAGESVQLTATGGGMYEWSNGQTTQTINVTPSTTTNYSVVVTGSNGCTDEDNVSVIVFQNPQADAGPDQSICEGETTSIIGSGGTSYEWSNGENTSVISVSPASTTSYQLTVTDMNGCTDTDVTTVVVNSIPFANAGTNVFILAGESATLTVTGGGTYEWSTGETTSQIIVTPAITTIYSVTVTVNGCSDIDEVTVFVNEAPSVDLGPDQLICQGETATIDATIAGPFELEYLWNTGQTTSIINVSPAMTTTYTVTATDNISGLSTIDSLVVNVLTLPLGNPMITGSNVICEGEVITYTVNGVTGATFYDWIVPANASIISGQGTSSVEVDWGNSSSGNVEVIVANSCGSLPAAILGVDIQTAPLLAGPVNGQTDPCAEGSGLYSITPVAGADTYTWTLPAGATISTGQGTANVEINWNGSAGGDICVVATNNCGSSVPICMNIATIATPVLSAGQDQTLCGLNAQLNGSGTGMWSFVAGPGTAQFSDAVNPASTVDVTVSGTYVFNYSFSQNGCAAEDQVEIIFNDVPAIINEIIDCNDINTAYEISFEIAGGQSPFTVNGNPFTGGIFNSGPIPSGDAYSFSVTDANGCTTQTISGQILCSCTSQAGMMDQTLIAACVDAQVTATFLDGETLDGNDKLAFILHDGNIPGGIISWSFTPQFQFVSPMLPGTTYYISAVVGDEGAGGLPQLSDPCLAVAAGTPVIFYDFPEVTFMGDTTICKGSCTNLIIESTGNGSLEIIYSLANQTLTFSASPGLIEIPVCPDSTSVYTIHSVEDQFCKTLLSDQVQVIVRESPFAGIPMDASACEGSNEVISLASLINDADTGGTWSEVSAIPSSPGAFDPSNGIFSIESEQTGTYTFTYTIAGLDGCPGSTASLNIIINDQPLALAGEDETLACEPAEIILDATGSSSGQNIQFQWTTPNGVIDGPADSIQIKAAKEGIYILRVTDIQTGCVSFDSVEVLSSVPVMDDILIKATPPLCAGECNGVIEIQNAGSGLLFDFGDGNFTSNNFYDVACSGIHVITLKDSFGCTLDTVITIDEPAAVEVSLGPDMNISFGDSITLTAETSPGIIQYNWFGASSCTSCPQITVLPSENTIYVVEVIDSNLCAATDEVTISLNFSNDIFIPTVFSPNGDGINDIFLIAGGNNLHMIESFEIFDRWGSKVFEIKNLTPGSNQGWDGHYKGSPVSPGVYVYVARVLFSNGDDAVLRGDITLLR